MITLNNINISFDDNPIIGNSCFEAPDTSFIVINGESGSGKTTF